MNKFISSSFPRVSHLLWIICIVISIRAGYYWMSDGFSLFKIQNTFPIEEQWRVDNLGTKEQKALKKLGEQPFYYLAKGSQAYAFISEDRQYVLKLFKCYHLSPVEWLAQLPLPEHISKLRDEAITKRYKKIDATLNSYKISATSLRTECSVVAMQILPNTQFHQKVCLIDKLGRNYTIDLGDYGFIVQRRADLIYPMLSNWIKTNDLPKAKKALTSIVSLIVQRSKKGIQDSDPDLHKNAGLIGTDAIFIDLGSFHLNPEARRSEIYTQDLLKITNNIKVWLQNQSPELVAHLENEIRASGTSSWKKPNE